MSGLKRGRAYKCTKCQDYVAEKGRMETHYYKHHLSPRDSPFYCNLCNYSAKTFSDLRRHTLTFLPHEREKMEMMRRGEFISDEHYLQRNANPYRFTLADYILLNREESATHWEARKKSKPDDELCPVVNQSPVATAEKAGPSPAAPVPAIAENFLDQLLGSGEVMEIPEPTLVRNDVGTQTDITGEVTTGEVTLQGIMRAVEQLQTLVVVELGGLKRAVGRLQGAVRPQPGEDGAIDPEVQQGQAKVDRRMGPYRTLNSYRDTYRNCM